MQRRVFGIETEYGITCAGTGTLPNADEAAHELFMPVVQMYRSANVFLPNGGRLYVDVGSHPEYATAECDNLSDLIAQDNAGEELLKDLAASATARLRERGVDGSIHLFKNNVDSQGNSCGCHENYLLRRNAQFRSVADALVAFFISRQILVGAGFIRHDVPSTDPYDVYCYSQRADYMDDAVSAATTRTRPIINTRDEPLADGNAFRRMHVIVGDSNIAQPTTALKVGSTHALLYCIEHSLNISDLALAHPMQAIRDVSAAFPGDATLELADGRTMTASDMQQVILQRICEHPDFSTELDPLMGYVLDLWQRGIDAVKSGDWTTVNTELDWAIKFDFLHAISQAKSLPFNSDEIARLDLGYHDIVDTFRTLLEQAGRMKRLVKAEDVTRATRHAPTGTRAYLRGKVLEVAQELRADVSADWLTVRLDGSGIPPVSLKDPFQTSNQKIDEIIEHMHKLYDERHDYLTSMQPERESGLGGEIIL